jgi:hypothetical protein
MKVERVSKVLFSLREKRRKDEKDVLFFQGT